MSSAEELQTISGVPSGQVGHPEPPHASYGGVGVISAITEEWALKNIHNTNIARSSFFILNFIIGDAER